MNEVDRLRPGSERTRDPAIVVAVGTVDAHRAMGDTASADPERLDDSGLALELPFQARAVEDELDPLPHRTLDLMERCRADSRPPDGMREAVEDSHFGR